MQHAIRRLVVALTAVALMASVIAPGVALAKPSLHVWPESEMEIPVHTGTTAIAYVCDPDVPERPFGRDGRPRTDDDDCVPAKNPTFRTTSEIIDVSTGGYSMIRDAEDAATIWGRQPGEAIVRIAAERGKGKKARTLRTRLRVTVIGEASQGTDFASDPLERQSAQLGWLFTDGLVPIAGGTLTPDEIEQLLAETSTRVLEDEPIRAGEPTARTLVLCADEDGLPELVEAGVSIDGQRCVPHPGDVTWSGPDDSETVFLRGDGAVADIILPAEGTTTISADWSLGEQGGRVDVDVTAEARPGDGPPAIPGDRTGDGEVDLDDLVDLGTAMLSGDFPAATEVISTVRHLTGSLPDDDPGSGDVDGDGDVDGEDVAAAVALEQIARSDPGFTAIAVNGDTNLDGVLDADDIDGFAGEGTVLIAEPQSLTLLVGGSRRADAYLCPAMLDVQGDPASRLGYSISYQPVLGDDEKAGSGDDGCEYRESTRWFSTDQVVATVARRTGLVSAASPGDTLILPDARGLFPELGQVRPMTLRVNLPPQQGPEEPPSNAGDVIFHIVPEEIRVSEGDIAMFGVVACENGVCRGTETIDEVMLDGAGATDLTFTTPPWLGIEATTAEGFDVVRAIIGAVRVIASMGISVRDAQTDALAGADGLAGISLGDMVQLLARRGATPGGATWDARFDFDGNEVIDAADVETAIERWADDGGDPADPFFRALLEAEPPAGAPAG